MKRRICARRGAALGSAGLLAGAVLLTGCGDDSGSGTEGKSASGAEGKGSSAQSPADAVQATNAKTTEAETARMKLKVAVSGSGEQAAGKSVSGDGTIDLKDGTSELRLSQGGQRIEQRVVDQVLYQKLPKESASRLPDGKTWMKIDLGRLQGSGAGGAGAGMNNPADSLAYSKSLSEKDVKKLGTEDVNGTETTHYRVDLDLSKLAKGDPEQEKKLRAQLGDRVPVELWIDDKGLTRRQQIELTARDSAGSGSAKKTKIATTVELSDFGTDVDVQAPPSGKTADLTDEVAKGGRQAS
ncbi:LppX_LprAFG lipoprotein [Streptomyces sp. PU-14G]|uniref:LppX_LprAFG lipoprotein n=1 Tax=Streptomyces sp. PU-14G TaxID=2800808 RepID=UPI0034DF6638